MPPPSLLQKDQDNDGDFDSVFGSDDLCEGSSTRKEEFDPSNSKEGYGSFLTENVKPPLSKKDPIKMTKEEAQKLIQNILSRKPPPISPTLPKLEPDLTSLRSDPLDLLESCSSNDANVSAAGRLALGSTRVEKRPKPRPTTAVTPRSTRTKATAIANTKGITSPTKQVEFRNKIKGFLDLMKEIQIKEEFSDVISDWITLIRAVEKDVAMDLVKSPSDAKKVNSCLLIISWISEHLVDCILKRIQLKTVVADAPSSMLSNSDPNTNFLAQIAQISAFRETARQSYLRAVYNCPLIGDLQFSNYLSLQTFIEKLQQL